jgi:acetyltransferase EpsM
MTDHSDLPLVFIGAGGFARELLGWMACDSSWVRPVALVQDNSGDPQLGVKVVNFESLTTQVRFVLAVSSPYLKEKLALKALSLNWVPVTYIDQTSVLGLNTRVGRGTVISPFSSISTNAIIGEFVTLNCRSGVGHESFVGDFSTLLGSNQVNGNVKVADRVTLGAGSIIHPGRKIGSGATVGIGSVVLNNVEEKSVVFGNPAKRISAPQTP